MATKKGTKTKKSKKPEEEFVPATTTLPDFPDISSRVLGGLAAKVRKAKDNYKKESIIDDLVEWDQRSAFWWSLLRNGVVPFWSEPLLWGELADHRRRDKTVAPPGDVALLLSKITSYESRAGWALTLALPSWPKPLDDLVLPAYLDDPSAFLAYETWAEPAARGFVTVLIRAGAMPKEKLGAEFARELARLHLSDGGLTDNQNFVKDGEPWVYEEMYDKEQHPTQDFWDFIGIFTSREQFLAALDEEAEREAFVEKHNSSLIYKQIDVLRRAPIPRLARHLDKSGLDDQSVRRLYALFAARQDPPSLFFELARRLKESSNDLKSDVAWVTGALRAVERGEPVPEEVDELCGLYGVQVGYKPIDPVYGIEEAARALAALGRERAIRIMERIIDGEYSLARAFPLLHAFALEPSLMARAFARLSTWRYGSREIFMGIALFPPSALPLLADKHDEMLEAGGPVRAELIKRGIQGVLAKAAQAGLPWDAAFDRFLDVHGYEVDIDGKPSHNIDYEYSHYVAPVLRVAVKGLPEGRRRAWLLANVDAEKPGFARVLPALPRDDDALIGEAIAAIARHHERVRMAYTDWLSELARDLGDRMLPHVRTALETSQSQRFKKSFDDALGEGKVKAALSGSSAADLRQETPAEKIARLATGIEGPPVAITILTRLDKEDEEEDEAALVGVSRVGGPGFDLGERQPRHDGEPMTHIFTLAVSDVPGLGAAFPEAAAVALYVANPDMNEASRPYNKQTAVVALRDDDLTRSAAQPTKKDLTQRAVATTTIAVPRAAFSGDAKELRGAIYQLGARAGGEPLWLQEEEDGGQFLLQFDESFASVNLGDAGVMYVFDDTAYWQCH